MVQLPAQRLLGVEADDDGAVLAHDESVLEAQGVHDLEGTGQGATGGDHEMVTVLGEPIEHLPHRLRQ